MATIFSGFSTVGSTQQQHYKMYDIKLVCQDLYNHFNTRLGERVMRPDFGCAIWDYFMEPFTESLENKIVNEAVRIVSAESRVTLLNMSIVQFEAGIRLDMLLQFKEFDTAAEFQVAFENRQTDYYA